VVGLGDELCELLCALFQVAAHLLPTVRGLLLQALFPPLFSSVLRVPCPSAACPFQFLVYYSIFFPGKGSECPGGSAEEKE
jgi:hypothetical protein